MCSRQYHTIGGLTLVRVVQRTHTPSIPAYIASSYDSSTCQVCMLRRRPLERRMDGSHQIWWWDSIHTCMHVRLIPTLVFLGLSDGFWRLVVCANVRARTVD